MKRITLLIVMAASLTGCCLSQIPTQYAYVDDSCTAILPDFTGIVIARDNCDFAIINQYPQPGEIIRVTTNVEIEAVDGSGNAASVFFDVVLLDTIPPAIQLNPEWTGYSDQEVGDMYRTFYGWVQNHYAEFNELFAWDSIPGVPVTLFYNNIPIPDTVRQDWWWATE